jgi:DNA repair exonuclease SbcCD ATPase subunit
MPRKTRRNQNGGGGWFWPNKVLSSRVPKGPTLTQQQKENLTLRAKQEENIRKKYGIKPTEELPDANIRKIYGREPTDANINWQNDEDMKILNGIIDKIKQLEKEVESTQDQYEFKIKQLEKKLESTQDQYELLEDQDELKEINTQLTKTKSELEDELKEINTQLTKTKSEMEDELKKLNTQLTKTKSELDKIHLKGLPHYTVIMAYAELLTSEERKDFIASADRILHLLYIYTQTKSLRRNMDQVNQVRDRLYDELDFILVTKSKFGDIIRKIMPVDEEYEYGANPNSANQQGGGGGRHSQYSKITVLIGGIIAAPVFAIAVLATLILVLIRVTVKEAYNRLTRR